MSQYLIVESYFQIQFYWIILDSDAVPWLRNTPSCTALLSNFVSTFFSLSEFSLKKIHPMLYSFLGDTKNYFTFVFPALVNQHKLSYIKHDACLYLCTPYGGPLSPHLRDSGMHWIGFLFFLTLPFETIVTSAFLPQVIREQRSRKNPATICHLIKFENKEILEHTVVILAHNKREMISIWKKGWN